MSTARGSSEDPIKAGAAVEVCFDDEGFRGSWFTATVIRRCSSLKSSKPRVIVEFHTLTVDEKSNAKLLREPVDLVLVRPAPPRESERRFKVGEDVDVFLDDGWWEGIVMSVNEDKRTYSVFFRPSQEQQEFPEAQIRLHREWVSGNWVPPLDEGAPM